MENTLATVDKVFKVELMKMPPSLQNTLIGDLISGESSVIFVILSVLHEQQLPTVFSVEEEFVASEESIASKVSWVSGYNLLSILLYIFLLIICCTWTFCRMSLVRYPSPGKR